MAARMIVESTRKLYMQTVRHAERSRVASTTKNITPFVVDCKNSSAVTSAELKMVPFIEEHNCLIAIADHFGPCFGQSFRIL